jgi:hypothetical protein
MIENLGLLWALGTVVVIVGHVALRVLGGL